MLTKADTPAGRASTRATATEAFCVSAHGGNSTLFVRQDFVEASYGFVQLFAQTPGAFLSGLAGIFTDTTGPAGPARCPCASCFAGIYTFTGPAVAVAVAVTLAGTAGTRKFETTTAISVAVTNAVAAITARRAAG